MNYLPPSVSKIIEEYCIYHSPFRNELLYKTRDIRRCFDYDYDNRLGFRRDRHSWMVLKSKFHNEWIIDKCWCSNTKNELVGKLWAKKLDTGKVYNSCYIYY